MDNNQPQGKRSIALPVTLLLLVMSVMGNVLLYTKNIEHTRGQAQEDGLAIYSSFEEAGAELAYWSELGQSALQAADAGVSRATAGFLAQSLARSESGLGTLFDKAGEIDPERFADARQTYDAFVASRIESLTKMEAAGGPLSQSESEVVASAVEKFAELDAAINEFHFTGKDSSSVLIRLSGGHDWLDVMEKLLVSVQS